WRGCGPRLLRGRAVGDRSVGCRRRATRSPRLTTVASAGELPGGVGGRGRGMAVAVHDRVVGLREMGDGLVAVAVDRTAVGGVDEPAHLGAVDRLLLEQRGGDGIEPLAVSQQLLGCALLLLTQNA